MFLFCPIQQQQRSRPAVHVLRVGQVTASQTNMPPCDCRLLLCLRVNQHVSVATSHLLKRHRQEYRNVVIKSLETVCCNRECLRQHLRN